MRAWLALVVLSLLVGITASATLFACLGNRVSTTISVVDMATYIVIIDTRDRSGGKSNRHAGVQVHRHAIERCLTDPQPSTVKVWRALVNGAASLALPASNGEWEDVLLRHIVCANKFAVVARYRVDLQNLKSSSTVSMETR